MYFKVFRTQSWGKKAGQDKTGVFRGALTFIGQFEMLHGTKTFPRGVAKRIG